MWVQLPHVAVVRACSSMTMADEQDTKSLILVKLWEKRSLFKERNMLYISSSEKLIGVAWCHWYLGIETISVEYRDNTLQPPS